MTTLALAGLGIVLAPWLYRSRTALNQARADKVRADARADMAAHLHDSVLQTLALIQRQADDPKAVQQLARRQERELRTWLYGEEAQTETLKAALTAAAAEVEDERGVPVEVVMVGDCETSDAIQALVRAAREAMVNAAKHSGADKIDVYAEVDEERIEVFVRDRGQGFDVDAVADDRMGVKGSIVNRMARHGGTATVRSRPGDGHRSTTGDQAMSTPTAPEAVPAPSARAGPTGWWWSTTTPCSGPGSRPRSAPRCRWSARRPTPDPAIAMVLQTHRTWCCWTCTCPAAAASRCCARCTRRTPTRSSWPCRSPTRPRT